MFKKLSNNKTHQEPDYGVKGQSNARVRTTFNFWKRGCLRDDMFHREDELNEEDRKLYIKHPDEFDIFIAGMRAGQKRDSTLSELAFPKLPYSKIVLNKPVLQIRPYDDNYNEDEIYLDREVRLNNTIDYEDDYENCGELYGRIQGVRIVHINDIPEVTGLGIITHYDTLGINLRNKEILLYWAIAVYEKHVPVEETDH